MNQVKRALISVYNKEGVVEFAKALAALGVEIISTGGTAELLKKEGIPVKEISSVTHFPEMLDGRVKTLHPNIHAGILAARDNPRHMETLEKHKIAPIDLLVVNLYPFWDAVKTKTDPEEIIEMIDIGGPSMLRSAAKNFRFVGAVSDPSDYSKILSELKGNNLSLSELTQKRLAAKVFKLTSYYDGLIGDYFGNLASGLGLPDIFTFPQDLKLNFRKIQDLRYGENPHQKAALYAEEKRSGAGVVGATKLHGKELSFNNILDLDAALEMIAAFEEPACAIIKHNNPCGFAIGRDAGSVFKKAYACDPLSAFGSIIGFNGTVDKKTATAVLKSGFVECIIAVGFKAAALRALKSKKNLRLLKMEDRKGGGSFDFKKINGGLLLQERDSKDAGANDLSCVTKVSYKKSQVKDLLFAFKVCRFVKSNAIVVAKNGATLGIGMGQPSRVDSCEVALKKAGPKAKGAVIASDGFFPKPDSIRLAKKYGIMAIIQPGGSIQDEEVIRACNQAKIAMVMTGIRHFKH